MRHARRPVHLAVLAILLAVPAPGYRFYSGTRLTVVPSAEAFRWAPEDFPLRFRILENDHLPAVPGLTDATWQELIERAFAHWSAIPTARISIVVEEKTLAADRAADDGINTVGFGVPEGDEDEFNFAATARRRSDGGDWVGCDIEVNPLFYEGFYDGLHDREDPDNLFWSSIENTMIHEMGHCLGLAHSGQNPMWARTSEQSAWAREVGLFPDGVSAFSPDPNMSVGWDFGIVGLTPDDEVAASLLYPAIGFLQSRRSLGGRVVFESGDPAPFLYVQALNSAGTPAFGPGTFTDQSGQFLLEGLRPGPVMLWIHPVTTLPAHSFHETAREAGSLDVLDRWHWARVPADPGVLSILSEITVVTGRPP